MRHGGRGAAREARVAGTGRRLRSQGVRHGTRGSPFSSSSSSSPGQRSLVPLARRQFPGVRALASVPWRPGPGGRSLAPVPWCRFLCVARRRAPGTGPWSAPRFAACNPRQSGLGHACRSPCPVRAVPIADRPHAGSGSRPRAHRAAPGWAPRPAGSRTAPSPCPRRVQPGQTPCHRAGIELPRAGTAPRAVPHRTSCRPAPHLVLSRTAPRAVGNRASCCLASRLVLSRITPRAVPHHTSCCLAPRLVPSRTTPRAVPHHTSCRPASRLVLSGTAFRAGEKVGERVSG